MIETCKTIEEVRVLTKEWRKEGYSVGLVPTMGYLHEGHKSLIQRAVSENDKVIVSDFVNPTQFGPNEDLAEYPRDIDMDTKLCEETGADAIFNPEPDEMYVKDSRTFVTVDGLTKELCGKSRPIHFRGVCTVVTKLFNIVMPDRAYFGEKDAQQLAVIRKMVEDLNIDIKIVGCPIVREYDGLAKSSRNKYLNDAERKAAPILHKALNLGKEAMASGEKDASKVKSIIIDMIKTEELSDIDYVEIVDAKTVEKVDIINGPVLCALAVKFGDTRLIDNFSYDSEEK